MKLFPIIILLILSVIFPVLLHGDSQNGETDKDDDWTVITCDGNLLMDYKNHLIVFFNNVLVNNPRGSLRADRLVIYLTPDGKKVERTEGLGNIRVKMEDKIGTSEKIIYYPMEKRAIMLGNARVSSGSNSVQGGRITFYLDKKEMEVEESPDIEYVPEEDYDISF